MRTIGITGISGAGKTTISEQICRLKNAKHINADKIAKDLTKSGSSYYKEVVEEFGADILRLWVLSSDFKGEVSMSKDILKQILNPETIFANREEIKKHFENIGIELEKFFLDLKIGTGELFTTAFLIPTLATIIAVFLSKKSDKIDYKDINYNIKPIYEDKFLYDIKFRCIINVRVVHIIYMIYVLKKGKKESDKCGGTSNRKFNANCNV